MRLSERPDGALFRAASGKTKRVWRRQERSGYDPGVIWCVIERSDVDSEVGRRDRWAAWIEVEEVTDG